MNLRDRRIPAIAVSVSFWIWCGLLSYPMISENVDLADPEAAFTAVLPLSSARQLDWSCS